MERIHLTKEEKVILRHIMKGEVGTPRNLSVNMNIFHLATLHEKGLVEYRANGEDAHDSRLTAKGKAYLEYNPQLSNPIDWKSIITIAAMLITAIATSLALFISCCLARP